MKRMITLLLAVCLLICAMPFSAAAMDNSRSYELDLTVNGSHEVCANPGDILTVNVTLRRTDAQDTAPMYAMQDEIRYDDEFVELVEGSILTSSGIETTDIALMDGDRAFYTSFVSLSGGDQWKPELLLGTFQIQILGEKGSTTLKNENALVYTKDGSDTYQLTVQDLRIIVTDECTVYFDSCGGSEIEEQAAHIGGLIPKPNDPVREGYVFAGWYTEPELENRWNFDQDLVQGDMTLYAAWEIQGIGEPDGIDWWWLLGGGLLLLLILLLLLVGKKTVKFLVDDAVYHTENVKRGTKLILPVNPRKPGFLFAGWSENPQGGMYWDEEKDEVRKSIKLYAQWKRIGEEDTV